MARCSVEIFVGGRWNKAGDVHLTDEAAGYVGPARFEYDLDYLELQQSALGANDARAVSCRGAVLPRIQRVAHDLEEATR